MDIEGKTLIQRVYEQASKARSLCDVIVATDDERIKVAVEDFGGKAILTSAEHPSGTDRCFEALQQYGEADALVNIQGDEPFIQPEQIESVCALLKDESVSLATLIRLCEDRVEIEDRNEVKVTFTKSMNALFFSRSVIPYDRNAVSPKYYQHIGIYGYTTEVLSQIVDLDQSPLEKAESLEQLRWLENGYSIRLGITELNSMGVDTPEDLEKARKFARTFV